MLILRSTLNGACHIVSPQEMLPVTGAMTPVVVIDYQCHVLKHHNFFMFGENY